ncbi:MAG: DNA recombination protein RmuC [Polyangiales bacterium]
MSLFETLVATTSLGALLCTVVLLVRQGRDRSHEVLSRLDALELRHAATERTLSNALRDELDRARRDADERERHGRAETRSALEALRETTHRDLEAIRGSNEQKLEAMRATVAEKLETSLERRLGESFRLVTERLEQVHRGLGEMQELASGVSDLRRVMTNVKARGTWGEYVLGNLLEQVLAPEQYEANCRVRRSTEHRVEFAVKLPGPDDDAARPVYLPIDSKFPREDYERLVAASEAADPSAVDEAQRALESRILAFARDVRDKYVAPPETTDFAILFVPTEGLYAELLRRPGLVDKLQDLRISLAGPTTLLALLNSLRMGFRTLAIQKRSSEVWKLLGGVKTEFGRLETWLAAVQRKIQAAASEMEDVEKRTRQMSRRLARVEELPPSEARALLGLAGDEP